MGIEVLRNYIGGQWVASATDTYLEVRNPALDAVIARVPLSTVEEVNRAVTAAREAFESWRRLPIPVRARYLLRLRDQVERRFEDLARTIVQEHGKTLEEARGEMQRTLENIEAAAGMFTALMGYHTPQVADGIDEECILEPVGVFCCIAPFNFPAMIPSWFFPYALVAGNTYIVKPSEICPITQTRLFELIHEVGFPPGVINMVHGGKEVVDALLTHPDVAGVSFVGSTPVAKYVYATAAAHGKRAQCHGGAKNALVVMPDADLERTVPAILSSAFGSAGQRCLAGSLVMAVGEIHEPLRRALVEGASRIRVGYGLDEGVQMGPVVSRKALERIHRYIELGLREEAELLLDGRGIRVPGYPNGYFIGPTIFDGVQPKMTIACEEIFGPVLGVIRVRDLEEALEILNGLPYGNAASLFTRDGRAAREFRLRVRAGNVGINIGVAAPIAPYPFAGQKQSFFGDLHGQGMDTLYFFTDRKVVITRWF
jgi:malonate-semialdehyde dehydrogenase (acetylating)/methylmalonate-semialdehyde dehydrogenase